MKFYSQITKEPNAVIVQVKDGLKIVSQEQLCVFINGEFETDDPKLIETLQKRPDLFRTDHPWDKPIGNKVKFELLKYKELLIKAKGAGIKTHKVKKEVIIEALKRKEGELNGIS